MCRENNNSNNCCCNEGIKDILETIVALQRAAVREEEEEGCDRRFLGGRGCEEECNTRPITFYTFENKEIEFPTRKNNSGCEGPTQRSCVFRVEKVEDCTATCRVLREKERKEHGEREECEEREERKEKFVATKSLFTININSIGAIRCLEDTFVELCI